MRAIRRAFIGAIRKRVYGSIAKDDQGRIWIRRARDHQWICVFKPTQQAKEQKP